MQNSTVISRVNAGLSRCLSHHRKLCRSIAELDCLIFNDEFLKDPRTQWLLHQRRQKEVKHKVSSSLGRVRSEVGRLLDQSNNTLSPHSAKSNLAVTRAFCQLLQAEPPSGVHTPRSRTHTGPLPAFTPLPSPERRPSLRVSASLPRTERKASSKACCQSG
ncbi:uncharacterized protein LOC108044972 [Drosophila rhopaloa]|uniref:Uncharacterized protein LOC108044972 n=1 Tax=Drosophila rhopaloa TaxID=1041015 RepID=A0A6P4ENG7_DRORH|nr:uncharacterized protein LOC108044972 [Drosophila rhopaloa]